MQRNKLNDLMNNSLIFDVFFSWNGVLLSIRCQLAVFHVQFVQQVVTGREAMFLQVKGR